MRVGQIVSERFNYKHSDTRLFQRKMALVVIYSLNSMPKVEPKV